MLKVTPQQGNLKTKTYQYDTLANCVYGSRMLGAFSSVYGNHTTQAQCG